MAESNYMVINKAGCIHTCHTRERYEAFKSAGWKDYKASSKDNDYKTSSAEAILEK